jgi:hypothetical protein
MKLKYIIDEFNGIMIFPLYVNHDVAAAALTGGSRSPIIGAGFIEIFDGVVTCYGRSESLDINSNGNGDAQIIANKLDLKIDNL